MIVDPVGSDGQPITITESGAIPICLARKFGSLIPATETGKISMFEWIFFNSAGLGPALRQSGYRQRLAPEPLPAAIERFHGEAKRTLIIPGGRLGESEYLAGNDYSISDIANFSWIWRREFAGVYFEQAPHVARRDAAIESRAAAAKAIAKLSG